MPLAGAPGHTEVVVGRGTEFIQFCKSGNKFLISKAMNKIMCYTCLALDFLLQAAESSGSDPREQVPCA